MLKILTFLILFLYLGVQYGQNLMDYGCSSRKDFYFIGMALVHLLVSFVLFKLIKNTATSFYLFMCAGTFINELYFNGSLSYIDVSFGIFGIAYILIKDRWRK